MTKLDLVKQVMQESELHKSVAEEMVETIFKSIKDTLASGNTVILRRFGSFSVVKKKKRMGRNPKTGESAKISARKVVRFKAGRHFKEAVDN